MTDNPERLFVVGIGASAGGLEAITELVGGAPERCGMAFVVIQHLSPDHRSMMPELLSRQTKLGVRVATDGLSLEPDTVYVMEPKTRVRLTTSGLSVEEVVEHVPDPIDTFFASMAEVQGSSCGAVVLSGTGSDGAQGLCAVRRVGGLTVVQRPETAQFESMPKAALATGAVDLTLAPREIIAELAACTETLNARWSWLDEEPGGVWLGRMLSALQTHTGLNFGDYKTSTVARRIERRMTRLGETDAREYGTRLRRDSAEAEALRDELLIGVTQFMRDTGAIDALRSTAIPRLLEMPEDGPLRLWVAGCSTGEEAYSMAILVMHALEQRGDHRPFRVFATDVDERALKRAAEGRFSDGAVEAIPEELRRRYLKREGDRWVATRNLREKVLFSRHDLVADPAFPRIHLASCRNLLIYFKRSVQHRVLCKLSNCLTSSGLLWLGASESLGDLAEHFEVLDRRWKVFGAVAGRPRCHLVPISPRLSKLAPAERTRPELGATAEALLRGFLPPTLVADSHFRLAYRYGDVNGILRAPEGRATLDLRELMPRHVAALASMAFQRASSGGEDVVCRGLRVDLDDGRSLAFDLRARQIPSEQGRLVALIFERSGASIAQSAEITESDVQQRVVSLERELNDSRASLQVTVEELESSNEELQATNEELLAANEELQSTNEELHSVNEELHTVNAEHAQRLEELTSITDDLEHLLSSLEVGIVFLDTGLCIRRFNHRASAFINVMAQDVGRPFAHLTHGLDYPGLLADCASVLRDGRPVTTRVESQGRHVNVRITGFVTAGVTTGVVVALTEVTEMVNAVDELVRFSTALEQIGTPVVLLDREGKVIGASAAAARIAGRNVRDLLGHHHEELSALEHKDTVRAAFEDARRGMSWAGILRGDRPDGTTYWEVVRFLPHSAASGENKGVLRIGEDLTRAIVSSTKELPVDREAPGHHEYYLWDSVSESATATPGLAELLGLESEAELSPAVVSHLMSEADRERVRAAAAQGYKTGKPWGVRIAVNALANPRLIETFAQPIDGPNGPKTRLVGRARRVDGS